jgi:6-pyruvoyltetrahydropterin/6-carboxytetrahydropterin synthase
MQTCHKTYRDLPFAHRAHKDKGHCAYIHGHSWTFEFTWEGEPDKRGFIVDFGALGWLRDWINEWFDHTCLFNRDDEKASIMVQSFPGMFQPRYVDSCSAEGIAKFLFEQVNALGIRHNINGRLVCVAVHEDSKNSARYTDDDWLEN